MDDEIDYRALYEASQRACEEAERDRDDAKRAHQEAERARQEAEHARQEAERGLYDIEHALKVAEKQLAKTSFHEFLQICHSNIFLKLNVETNELLRTSGGPACVDGKQYPRFLKPWANFHARLETSFARLETTFQEQSLFPSPGGLTYLEDKLRNKRLASEEDLKNFQCLAVDGCALDVLPRFFDLVGNGSGTNMPDINAPRDVSFNNSPFGVIATEEDEESGDGDEETGQDPERSGSRSQSRGRARTRSRRPLKIKDDRPAYIGALGVAKRDMDAAAERAALAAEERERSGPPQKRTSPDRTKVHPDQWCFRYNADGTIRPLFVIEYKAAHKIDNVVLRDALRPEVAATLMEDAIRAIPGNEGGISESTMAKRDIAKVFTQTFHYMVDYGLQYCYATTGYALIFLYLDPAQPSTLYYHLEEPKETIQEVNKESIRHSAVALVLSFVLMALEGQYLTNRWKKALHKGQPKWPQPYTDMENTPTTASLSDTTVSLTAKTAAGSSGDPQKQGSKYENNDTHSSTGLPDLAAQPTAEASPETIAADETKSQGSQQTLAWQWSRPVDAPLSPSLDYCTQACLLGLKTGGPKDPRCPNVHLHQRQDQKSSNDKYGPHPISAEELCELLVEQLAEDMDHDCQNLERFGMYGAIGALFKLALTTYGYCFVGKGVQRAHRKWLEKEAATYGLLETCQGRLVPVNLGVIQLVDEYWTECGAHISHMMLMSYAGDSLWHCTVGARRGVRTGNGINKGELTQRYREEAQRTLCELEKYGVIHGDEADTNLSWNEELQRVMAIDLDRAIMTEVEALPTGDGMRDRQRKLSPEPDTQPTKRARMGY